MAQVQYISDCSGSAESVLVDMVRQWVERVDPGDERIADVAAAIALTYYMEGASVPEACLEAQRVVLSRLRHPSHCPVAAGGPS